MIYYLPIILLLICGCSPSDPELKKIWNKNEAVILTNETGNIILVPSLFYWKLLEGKPNNIGTYSIKNNHSNDSYIIEKQHHDKGEHYKITKVYSELAEKTHNETETKINLVWLKISGLFTLLILIIVLTISQIGKRAILY